MKRPSMKAVYVMALSVLLYSCAEHEDDEGMGDDDATVESAEMPTTGVMASDAALSSFSNDYPSATNAEWDNEDELFEVTFNNNGSQMTATYTMDGDRFSTRVAISREMLPEPVMKNATAMGDITEVEQITLADGRIHYGVEVAGDDYIFDETGSMIENDAIDNDDTEDDNRDIRD